MQSIAFSISFVIFIFPYLNYGFLISQTRSKLNLNDGFLITQTRSKLISNPLPVPVSNCYPLVPVGSQRNFKLRASYEEENKGVTLKVLAVFVLGIIGLFGLDFSSFTKVTDTFAETSRNAKASSNLKTTEAQRGALTRLTRKEINKKLQQLPLFFATKDGGESVFVQQSGDGKAEGIFFTEKGDADAYANSLGKDLNLKVTAVPADDLYYSLIVKKQKMGKFIEGVAGKSDQAANYILRASSKQIENTNPEWKIKHPNDVPLFRVTNLAFQKPQGLEIPLFTRKEDALNAYSRLQQETKDIKEPEVQVTSLNDLIGLFSAGGFEGRSVEIYPSIDALEAVGPLLDKY